jgi:hydroxyacylglutathione hydrolase
MNPLLQLSRDAFVERKVHEHHEYTPYFRKMEKYNLEGPPILNTLPNPKLLSPTEFQGLIEKSAVVVDTRMPPAFGSAHIMDAYSIWLSGLPLFSGWVLPYDRPILLVVNEVEHVQTAVRYLYRMGYDLLEGYILGVETWSAEALPLKHLGLLTVQELKARLDKDNNITVLDVRSDEEWHAEHIKGAIHMYVGHLEESIDEILPNQPTAVICSIGNRASLGASILQRKGYKDVHIVLGGMFAWQNAGYPATQL